jgi:hypothetical protein
MSWFSKNYEKAALGGAVLVAIGLAYAGWSKLGGIEEDFPVTLRGPGGKGNDTAVPEADKIPKAIQSLKIDRTWQKAQDGDRPVDLFTGIALFVSSNAPDKPVDLLKDDAVHDPIPNTWWLEHRLDPGFADSPVRDPDGDGFNNLEEFTGETDPNNPKSHPALIAKLTYVRDETVTWAVRPGYGSGGKFPFTYWEVDGKLWRDKNKITASQMIGPDELFFLKEPMKDRFKLLGSEQRRELNKRTNSEVDVTIVRIEDQRHNKKGDIYEVPSPLQEERINEYAQFDRTAVFTLEAVGEAGKEFKVEERTPFGLPSSSPEKDYLLKSVTPTSVVVEYPAADGSRKTVEIQKGAMPNLGE